MNWFIKKAILPIILFISSFTILSTSSEAPEYNPIQNLIKEAKTHIGKKYVWASKGPNTFDCSGFTSYIYKKVGYNISGSSRSQYKLGCSIDKHDLLPGDLVFFSSPRRKRGVGHVGMVIENYGDYFSFIHASVKKGITISNSNESYYLKRYIGARRIIP